jgi:hypothetical protein
MDRLKLLKELANTIDKAYLDKYGKKMVYTVIEKRAIPAHLRENIGEQREGGYDVSGEKVSYNVNQYRRLKRIHKRKGANGVIHYLKKCGFQPDEKLILDTL